MTERFKIINDDDELYLKDEYDKLIIDKSFQEQDKEWLTDLVNFLNHNDKSVQYAVLKYGEVVHELNNLKETITKTLKYEIEDCELLVEVDNEDLYTQGRLIEIHNLMKALL